MATLPLLLLALAGLPQCGPPGLERIGRLDDPALREVSGIVASRRHPGIFWVHNDSGNPPAVFAVRRDGTLVAKFAVAVPNIDWEDITTDDAGHLYLGEIGNNLGLLRVRAIYRIDEPDPARPDDTPLPVTLASYYSFPPGDRFDAESLVIDGTRALLIAKRHDQREAEIFAVPLDPPAPLFRPARAEKIGTLPGLTDPATGASLSADGRRLAVCSPRFARVYEKAEAGWSLIGQAEHDDPAIEAICWAGPDLILASEGRGLYLLREAGWRAGLKPRAEP